MAKSSKQKHRPTNNDDDNGEDNISGHVKGAKVKRTRKSIPRESPQPRSSIYRGVTRHRWTGRYEAHLWDKNSWNQSRNKKGRQVYLGAYDEEEAAAHAYDLAALKYCGHDTILNFPVSTYQEELNEMEPQSKEEYIGSLRRKSSGFSRGVSKYRGVARHHHNGRWEARIGRVFGNKYLYLGTYATQEEAAIAYDMAAVKYRGHNAITNFNLSRYTEGEEESSPPENNNNDGDDDDNDDDDTTSTVKQHPSQELGLTFLDPSPDGPTTTTASSSPFEQKPRSSFPDDVQTSFDFQDSGSFAEEHDMVFGEYDFLASSVFQCGLDA